MATCNYIKAKKQTQSAMKAVIRYVSQDMKTLDENGNRYLSGINCLGQAAYEEFMATKNLYGKRSGIYYYHYEQSFAPGEINDYDTAHEIGRRLAEEMFPGFEVLVGTHLDAYDDDGRQRVHNHFVINSVSFSSGMKLDYGPYTLEKMRRISDRLCEEHALSVLPEFKQTFDGRSIATREYRAAEKGDSWKFKAICTIENVMTRAATKEDFISMMESLGYSVTWTDSRKHITYTCPNGMKVRDSKLHESKFLKEHMQHEFTIRQQTIKQQSPNEFSTFQAEAKHSGGNADDDGNALSVDRIRDSEGAFQGSSRFYESDNGFSAGDVREARGIGITGSDERRLERTDGSAQRLVESDGTGGDERRQQYCSESTGSVAGEQGKNLTGWEDARAIFLSSEHENGQPYGIILGYDFRGEELGDRDDRGYGNYRRAVERGDLSSDELTSFFADERNLCDDMPFDEEDVATDEPIFRLREEADQGNIYAMYRLSRVYLDKKSRYYDEDLGDYYLERAAKANHNIAQYRMGKMFYYGIIYREDEYEAEKWLLKSARNGNPYADALLGKLYVESGLFDNHRRDGFEHLFRAERNGSAFAAYTLGKYFMEGKVVEKDIAKAIEHLEIASARGNMYADYRLAQLYLFEADIFDMEKALEYLNRSAEAGNEYATVALTRMANNQVLAVATNVLDILGSLGDVDNRPQIQDCTTMPKVNEKKKKREMEQVL